MLPNVHMSSRLCKKRPPCKDNRGSVSYFPCTRAHLTLSFPAADFKKSCKFHPLVQEVSVAQTQE